MLLATRSEREGRTIDKDPGASMEEKKKQGLLLMTKHE